jgi:segregation and condensation protein B
MTQDNGTTEPTAPEATQPAAQDLAAPHAPAEAAGSDTAPAVPDAEDPAHDAVREESQDPVPLDEVTAAQSRARLLRLVEALLFAAPGLVEIKEIARRLPDGAPVGELVQLLEEQYAGRGVNVVRVAGKIGLRTAPDLAGALAIEVPVARKLSRAAIETLAIVAYQHADNKAVTRAEIEEIRGVSISKGTLDQLMEAGWIKPHGYREHVPGRPAEWITTEDFLAHFGLDTLAQLPGVEELRAAGLLDRRPGVSQYGEQGALELPPEMGEQAEAEEGPVVDDDAPRPPADTSSPA